MTDLNVPDPTLNVTANLDAAVHRLDDLAAAESKRIDQILKAELRRVDEQMKLRGEYEVQLNVAEAKRIDAIRAVDVAAVAVANERATAQAAVLANQVAASAETLRALVAATAATVAQQLAQISAQFTDRLSALEKSSYTERGKQTIGDPQLVEMMAELKSLREARASTTGHGQGSQAMWGYVAAGAGFLLVILSIAGAIFALVK